jgi:hypothetical protein
MPVQPPDTPRILQPLTAGHRVPRLTKLGAAAIVVGILADAIEHFVPQHAHDAVVAGFSAGEHAAHLVALIGMVLVLVGVVTDGVASTRRLGRQEGSTRNAVR